MNEDHSEHSLDLRKDGLLDKFVLYTATVLFILTIILATMQVLIRNFLSGIDVIPAMLWTEPAARMALIVGAFWGAAVASRNHEHITIEFPLQAVRKRSKKLYIVLRVIIVLSVISYVGIVLYGLIIKTTTQWSRTVGGLEQIPAGVFFGAITVAFAVMLYYEVANMADEFRIVSKARAIKGRER